MFGLKPQKWNNMVRTPQLFPFFPLNIVFLRLLKKLNHHHGYGPKKIGPQKYCFTFEVLNLLAYWLISLCSR